MSSSDKQMQLKEAIAETSNEQQSMESNDKEQTGIRLMRAIVEGKDPTSKEVDDQMIRRFLHARDLDIEKASALFLKYLNWRRTFVPNGSISVTEIPNDLAQNKMFLQGLDKKGRPVIIFVSRRHFQTKGGLDELKRFLVYVLDKACSRMLPGQEKFVFIIDLEGWGFSNLDLRACRGALSILQAFSKLYESIWMGIFKLGHRGLLPRKTWEDVYDPCAILFMKVWKVIYTFIDSRTKQKIVFVENKKLKSTLLEEIDESQLPEIYGGKLPLVPIQDS